MNLDIQMVKGIKNMFFGAEALFLAKLTGPGKVHLQTMTLPGLAHALQPYIPEQGQQRWRRSRTASANLAKTFNIG